MKILIALMTFAMCFGSVDAFAKKKKRKKRRKKTVQYEQHWGMAGCGLWSQVITGKGKGPQIGVWVLRNLVLNSQTSAISSGTSGCVDTSRKVAQKDQEVFITINFDSLTKEAAQGEGYVLSGLAEVLGCQDQSAFKDFSQKSYETLYNSNSPETVLMNYKTQIKQNEQLASTCIRV